MRRASRRATTQRAGDADERRWIDDLHAAKVDANDRVPSRNPPTMTSVRVAARSARNPDDVDRHAVRVSLELDLAELHASLP